MKLNIINYNPDLKIDTEYVDELINMLLYALANYIECIDNISQGMVTHL